MAYEQAIQQPAGFPEEWMHRRLNRHPHPLAGRLRFGSCRANPATWVGTHNHPAFTFHHEPLMFFKGILFGRLISNSSNVSGSWQHESQQLDMHGSGLDSVSFGHRAGGGEDR